jgi:uncharacterized repeat protein (TIGR01451 family)
MVDNSAVATAADPFGNVLNDTSDDGTDGNGSTDPGEDDPTSVPFVRTPSIDIAKSITGVADTNGNGIFGDPGDMVTYDFTVTNTGNTALAGVTITDGLLGLSDEPVSPANLPVDGVATLTGQTYEITPQNVADGEVVNTATTSGAPVATDANGDPDPAAPLLDDTGVALGNVVDTSDTLTDPDLDADGNVVPTADPIADGDDNPTVLNLPTTEPEIALVKSITGVADTNEDLVLGNAGDSISYLFTATNTGNTSLGSVTISDPLLELDSVPMTPSVLAIGDSATFVAELTITDDLFTAGFVENTATTDGQAVATGPNGAPQPETALLGPTGGPLGVSDISDTGSEADAEDDGTIIQVGDPAGQGTGDDVTILNLPLIASPLVISGTVFLDTNNDGALDGSDDPTQGAGFTVNLLDENGNIVDSVVASADGTYAFAGFPVGTYTVQFVNLDGEVAGESNPISLSLQNPVESNVDFPLAVDSTLVFLTLTKTTPLNSVVLGGAVPYVITVQNTTGTPTTADLVDTLPPGLLYLPESGTIDGVAVEPTISDQTLTWPDVPVAAGATVTLELIARIGPNTSVGDLTNTVRALDPVTGAALAEPASATVRRNSEAVFDCSDIIGKVFDDRNFDGYQNGVNRSAITDQSFVGGKGPVVKTNTDEPGLPRVRLVTPTGTVITTDEYGRYSVPCAELPGDFGTNFTLKLDERSLPTGYRITTENPRTMRVTSGILTEMNFGATIGRVVDIDLTAAAFDRDNEPVERLEQGLVRILQQVADNPSVLRISYFSTGEDRAVIKDRLDELDAFINARWNNIGDYRLIVERDVKYLQ